MCLSFCLHHCLTNQPKVTFCVLFFYISCSILFYCFQPDPPTFPHFQPCVYMSCPLASPTQVQWDRPILPKRCPSLPSGKVVLEERATHPLPSWDHVLCQQGLSDQYQPSSLSPKCNITIPTVQNTADRWDSARSFPLPTVLKKQHGDGCLHASFLPSD